MLISPSMILVNPKQEMRLHIADVIRAQHHAWLKLALDADIHH